MSRVLNKSTFVQRNEIQFHPLDIELAVLRALKNIGSLQS